MQQFFILRYLIWILIHLGCCVSLSFTNQNYDGIQVGVPFTLTWEDAHGAVVLGLLFRLNASSPQNTTIIAYGITDSQFVWTPPDWTSGVFAQKIEAQDDAKNLALTGNFTVARVASLATSTQQTTNRVLSSSVAAKTAYIQSVSSSTTTSVANAAALNELGSAARVRIGFGICIVVVLIIIGVALIFFEHGKRIAARTEQRQQPKSPFERAEQGSMSLELVETNLTNSKEIEKEIMEEEPATPLLYKKPKLVVELDGGTTINAYKGAALKIHEEKREKVLSVRSIYELG